MDEVRDALKKLPEPEPEALERVWRRYRDTRAARRSAWAGWSRPAMGLGMAVAAVALFGFWIVPRDPPRRVVIAASVPKVEDWSDEIRLTVEGKGEIRGTRKHAEIHWRSGTITASVKPRSGNRLAVVTEEARVEVVGTVFTVTRDALGVHTTVERGRVRVRCVEGWSGEIGPDDGEKVCLPVRPELLLGRADALEEAGAPAEVRLQTLDAGLARAEEGSQVAGELLWRRMLVREELGDIEGLLADADRYLHSPGARQVEVQRYAGWKALSMGGGCSQALPYLSALEHTGSAEDRVLLAECVAEAQPKHARTLLDDALPQLEGRWKERAMRLKETLAP